MHFQHSGEIWRDFPEPVPWALFAEGITPDATVGDRAAEFTAIASSRLAEGPERLSHHTSHTRSRHHKIECRTAHWACPVASSGAT